MVGFVQNTTQHGTLTHHPITCFYAHKDFKNLYEDQVSNKKSKNISLS